MANIELIVGLGNPGPEYEQTRHNAGFWFVEAVARMVGAAFRHDAKHHGDLCRIRLDGREVWLLKPTTFMNRSGQSVASLARFYKIPPEQILVAHDELDIPPGDVRLKQGGGHGGHNGLRDIASHFGVNTFMRLRLGIGHPGHASLVTPYVLGRPRQEECELIDKAIDRSLDELPLILSGEFQKAMNRLHSA